MDLDKFCDEYNFVYYIKWLALCGSELTCRKSLGGEGQVGGAYGEAVQKANLKFNGGSERPTGVAGKAFASKNTAMLRTTYKVDENKKLRVPPDATEEEKTAAQLAMDHGVLSSWAIFRDGSVYEFGSADRMNELPTEIISKIGGSVGVLRHVTKKVNQTIAVVNAFKMDGGSATEDKDRKNADPYPIGA